MNYDTLLMKICIVLKRVCQTVNLKS